MHIPIPMLYWTRFSCAAAAAAAAVVIVVAVDDNDAKKYNDRPNHNQ